MRLFSAGTTFNDVRIPFPHVRVTGLAARSTLDNLRREHPTATPIIIGGDGPDDSLHLLFDEQLAFPFPPEEIEEVIERSLQGDGWSLQLAYQRDLHGRMLPRLKGSCRDAVVRSKAILAFAAERQGVGKTERRNNDWTPSTHSGPPRGH